MKGSMNVKVDLGWVFSLTLAIGVLVYGSARLSFAVEAQGKLEHSCQIFEDEMRVAGVDRSDEAGFYKNKCLSEFKKPTLNIALETDKWTYSEVYREALKSLNQ